MNRQFFTRLIAPLALCGLFGCFPITEEGVYDGVVGPELFSEPTTHDGDDWLFSPNRINRIDLTLDEDAVEILRSERRFSYPRNKVRADAVFDGEAIGDIGVRLRGGLGSFNRFDGKPKFELDFNRFSGEAVFGLKSISLNNMINDCSRIREPLAYAAYGLLGLPTSRTGYAQLFINGEDYGLFLTLETQDDQWLERTFDDGSGNLYDGKYVFSGFWPLIVDFGIDRDHWFDLEEGEDIAFEDVARVSRGVKQSFETGTMDSTLAELVDWSELTTLLRIEEWTISGDGYQGGPNNYRVYFEPGKPMVITPWDRDDTFQTNQTDGDSEVAVHNNPDLFSQQGSNLGQLCFADEDCLALWEATKPVVEARLLDGSLQDLGESIFSLLEPSYAEKAVRDENCSPEIGRLEAAAILDYIQTGEAETWSEGENPYSACSVSSAAEKRILPVFLLFSMLALWRRERRVSSV